MTRDYVISQCKHASTPGIFTSVLDPPQFSTIEWEQRAQRVVLALPQINHDRHNVGKYLHSISLSPQSKSCPGSGSENPM
jgi:hypothetical protein